MNYAKKCIYDNADTSSLPLDLEVIQICWGFLINLFILGIVDCLNMLTLNMVTYLIKQFKGKCWIKYSNICGWLFITTEYIYCQIWGQ